MKKRSMLFKRLLSSLLLAVLSAGVIPIAYTQTIISGDANESGNVDIVDALLVAQFAAGLNPNLFNGSAANVNCDTDINVLDALLIAKYAADVIATLACTPAPTATSTPSPIVVTCYPCAVMLEGYVTDSTTQLPVYGVNIHLNTLDYGGSADTTTNQEGYYSLVSSSCSSSEHIRIQASRPGYETQVLETTVWCSSPYALNLSLVPGGTPSPTPTPTATPLTCPVSQMVIAGIVVDAVTGLPLAGASVSCPAFSVLTDKDGNYHVQVQSVIANGYDCPRPDYTLVIKAAGYQDYRDVPFMYIEGPRVHNYALNPLSSATPVISPTPALSPTPTASPSPIGTAYIRGYAFDNITRKPIFAVMKRTNFSIGNSDSATGYYRVVTNLYSEKEFFFLTAYCGWHNYITRCVPVSITAESVQNFYMEPWTPPAPTPSPPPTPFPTGNLEILSFCPDVSATTPAIRTWFKIRNPGPAPLNVNTVSLRYWFTTDGDVTITYACTPAWLQCHEAGYGWPSVTGANQADRYFEVRVFKDYILAPGETSGPIILTLRRYPLTPEFNQENDYSFHVSSTGYEANPKVTGYISGALRFGVEPY